MATDVRTPLMAGNWKMNLNHQEAVVLVQKLAWTLDDKKHDYGRVEVVVLPPFTDLRSVQTLVDGDRLQIRYGAQDVSDARRRRLHRRDLGRDAGQARLLLRRRGPLRAPGVPRRDRRAGQHQGAQGAGRRHDADRVRRRGARGPAGGRARAPLHDPGRRLAGRVRRRAGRRAWSSPTSRSGRSAPARWRPPTTRRRCARRSAARCARRTATPRPTAYASCTAARSRRPTSPGSWPRPTSTAASSVARACRPTSSAASAASTTCRSCDRPVRASHRRDVGSAPVDLLFTICS